MSKLPNLMNNLNKIMDLAEPYMKRGVSEDWQEFIATVQKTGMEAEQAIEAYIAERETQARIDELERLVTLASNNAQAWYSGTDYQEEIIDRLDQLKSNERISSE